MAYNDDNHEWLVPLANICTCADTNGYSQLHCMIHSPLFQQNEHDLRTQARSGTNNSAQRFPDASQPLNAYYASTYGYSGDMQGGTRYSDQEHPSFTRGSTGSFAWGSWNGHGLAEGPLDGLLDDFSSFSFAEPLYGGVPSVSPPGQQARNNDSRPQLYSENEMLFAAPSHATFGTSAPPGNQQTPRRTSAQFDQPRTYSRLASKPPYHPSEHPFLQPSMQYDASDLTAPPAFQDDSNDKNQCDICGQTFSRPYDRRRHMGKHMEEAHYKCRHCTKTFYRPDKLYLHARRHGSVYEREVREMFGKKASKNAR
ncbi:hypothetical protein BU24DRAFT_427599 [Aaosphaeria arxii CBS 175.79]|uniref:C2H2-type domain-containing protein n=1 Tax=Aaosphaeria arxii CBS 175.79 TaxID=1450172 RepID=A0A6A5XCC9_9PLEO|nr:uncharacterized protein BU24DRAFT_427599 [Aaosphaeria arxii CBS 175.79]KAF2010476.1 hypothetical protein BU24DRAFT_427599 [Aaosphaeria arxii CBS 175.79]